MHFCTAHIAIGGDDRNVMYRDPFNPVSWPEIELLTVLHGLGSITEVRPFVQVRQPPRAERLRLAEIYGDEPCAVAWGGRNAPNEMEAAGIKLPAGVTWFNPLTRQVEITGKDGTTSGKLMPALVSQAETVGDMTRRQEIAEPFGDDDDEDDVAVKTASKKR